MINGLCFLLLILSRVAGISFVGAPIVLNYIPYLPTLTVSQFLPVLIMML